jgi:hypothetical protein
LNDRELGQLLAEADRPPPRLEAGLARRVRDRDRRGRRRSLAVALLVIAGALAAVITPRPRQSPAPDNRSGQIAVGQVRVRLHELSRQIEARRQIIAALLESERREALATSIGRLPEAPSLELDADRDRAAGTLLVYASELVRRAGREREAAVAYARVIDLFPDSPLAAEARQNLRAIER